MKNRASSLLKQIITNLTSKTLALKSKTKALKTRLIIFSLLHRNTTTLFTISSINHKLQSLLGHHHHNPTYDVVQCGDDDHDSEAPNIDTNFVLHTTNNAMTHDPIPNPTQTQTQTHFVDYYANSNGYEPFENDRDHDQDQDHDRAVEEENEKYPDLTHSLFGAEDGDDLDMEGSVIEMVKNSKKQEGEEFKLEDEIDQVADLFIKKFHRQMRLQKQQSLRRYQEMLQASA